MLNTKQNTNRRAHEGLDVWTRGLARFTPNRNNGLLRTVLLLWTSLCANLRRVARILSKPSRSFAVRILFEWSAVVFAQKDERQRKKGELERRAEDCGGRRSEVGFSVDASPREAMQTKMPRRKEEQWGGK